MKKMTVDEASRQFSDVIDYVRGHQEAVIVTGPNGDLVKVVPIPQPIDTWKGRPVYRIEDLQYLNDFPYPPEPEED
jgi:hypothetical protein